MDRETIRKRINALLNRTVARGCTEAEAMEAAARAAALMQEHGIDQDALLMAETIVKTRSSAKSARARLWPAIAHATNTTATAYAGITGKEVSFIGAEPWPEIAGYLFQVCERAVDGEVKRFRSDAFYRRRRSAKTKRQAVDDFTIALVMRLRTRIPVMFEETDNADLQQKAIEERGRRYPDTRTVRQKGHAARYDEAVTAGWTAGGSVPLSRGVGQEEGQRMLTQGGAA